MDREAARRSGKAEDGDGNGGREEEEKAGAEAYNRQFPSTSSSRLKGILVQLRQDEDEVAQLEALNQLNELLSISSEESLTIFPVEQLVPVLVHLLNAEHSPDIMLLAARALTFLADVLPSSCSTIVRHGAVDAFCARLLTIEYIDLAEQSLQALQKLSQEHPQAVLRQGGLMACLSFLDFFQTGVQRVAVATAANMCRGLTTANTDAVQTAVPILTNLLQYQDAKVAGVSGTLRSLLASSTLFSTANTSPVSVLRSSDQLLEVVSLAAELLPPLPDAQTVIMRSLPTTRSETPGSGQEGEACLRARFLCDNPAVLQRYSSDLLALLVQVYSGTVVAQVKVRCLDAIAKVLHHGTAEQLQAVLADVPLASFVAALLGARELPTLAAAVRLAELLMGKLPEGKDAEAKRSEKRTPPAAEQPAASVAAAPVTTLKQAAALRACRFLDEHFSADAGGSGAETEGVLQLRSIAARLGQPGAEVELVTALQGRDPSSSISTFEFLTSGVVTRLQAYLQGKDLADDADGSQLLRRLHAFAEATLAAGNGGSPPLLALAAAPPGRVAPVGDERAAPDLSEEDNDIIMLQGEGAEEGEEEEEEGEEDEVPFDEEADVEDAEDGGVGGMHVHDMHLGEAPTPAASASASRASPAQPAAEERAVAPLAEGAAAAAAGAGAEHKLRFTLGSVQLLQSSTIFQAIQSGQRSRQAGAAARDGEDAPAAPQARRLWDEVHTVQYCRYENPGDASTSAAAQDAEAASPQDAPSDALAVGRLGASPLGELLGLRLPPQLEGSEQTREVLTLLKLLEALRRLAPHLAAHEAGAQGRLLRSSNAVVIGREEFVSAKLAPKLAQQLKDVLAICGASLPPWCGQLVTSCSFLFPFELRRRYFYCSAFGLARALQHLQQQQAAEGAVASPLDSHARELRVGRLQRQKVRISRRRVLESAAKVFEMYSTGRAVLEIEYFGEVGTGLGPTLEFYTLLSHELQRRGLGLWRCDDGSVAAAGATKASVGDSMAKAKVEATPTIRAETALTPQAAAGESTRPDTYVHAPQGLFPAPLPPSERAPGGKVVERFRLLGRAMAKALQDSRLLDLPLSYLFYRTALGRPVDLYDVRRVDALLGASLERLAASHRAWAAVGDPSAPMLVDGAPIDDLCLSFVLPGYPEYELRAGGADLAVGAGNVAEYVEAVAHATLREGIQAQLSAFKSGFNDVFALATLAAFHEDELEAMLCGMGEAWTVEMLADTIKFDHGYTATSAPARQLLEILAELDAADQRRFLRFVTGSPRLPPGGLGALQPRLTVVRKLTNALPLELPPGAETSPGGQPPSAAADRDLPSVMTCANYIKLPPYSSKAVARARLLLAIREGQGSFDLS
ncbi:hypothetical protein WJX81_000175 [Elliptochloris bilobata]|uniref:HECT-type E3 ubiquitin transferase n=1 Tax=Elliptochloris bilobata TaxID=381761 RepID=A0AAW1QY11_9CHLO